MAVNEAQIAFWNGKGGETWVNAQERMDTMLQPISEVAVARAAVSAGERVIDIGCGCGATSLALNDHGAHVWGVDISQPMLARAKARALGRGNIGFSVSDAAVAQYTPDHNLIFSRFGVMFFDDPVAAFTNLRTSLTSNGRLLFACWQPPRNNPWMSVVGAAIAPLLPEPEAPVDPRAPGPFAFADPDYVQGILDSAGFRQIKLEPLITPLRVADDIEGAIASLSEVGPLARALAELDEDAQAQAVAVAKTALADYADDRGVILDSAVWIVSARN
ncbi:MAG: methyltransferase domain-containing protein [Pseudomonadota bacterium]